MISGLPTPPTEDKPASQHTTSRRTTSSKKSTSTSNRGTKRTSATLAHEHGGLMIDGRHKRVWKACERCRMKKTKCDGESPCKRCKDDGLVCTAGSRKKTEFKQLPRGYAEVLENTQYALIATVQKLYTMVRNNEPWQLGEPQLNDRGLPVIHNIAEKLGCIRPSPDLPCAFPEDEAEFAELQRSLFSNAKFSQDSNNHESEDEPDRKGSEDSRLTRASSSDSEHSALSQHHNSQIAWQNKNQNLAGAAAQFNPQEMYFKPDPSRPSLSTVFGSNADTIDSPVYSDFTNDSPLFRADSPLADSSFGGWGEVSEVTGDFMAPGHMLDLTALYMRQQQGLMNMRGNGPMMATGRGGFPDGAGFAPGGDGTIQPAMLEGGWGWEGEGMSMG